MPIGQKIERKYNISFESVVKKYNFLQMFLKPKNCLILELVNASSEGLTNNEIIKGVKGYVLNPARDIRILQNNGLFIEKKRLKKRGRYHVKYFVDYDKFSDPVCEINKLQPLVYLRGSIKQLYRNKLIKDLLRFENIDLSIVRETKKGEKVIRKEIIKKFKFRNIINEQIHEVNNKKLKKGNFKRDLGYFFHGSAEYLKNFLKRPYNFAVYCYLRECHEKKKKIPFFTSNDLLTALNLKLKEKKIDISVLIEFLRKLRIHMFYQEIDTSTKRFKKIYEKSKNNDDMKEIISIGSMLYSNYLNKIGQEEIPECILNHFLFCEENKKKQDWRKEEAIHFNIVPIPQCPRMKKAKVNPKLYKN